MKETDQKLDILLEKAGQINNYQFQVTFIFLIQLTCAEFFNQCLPFLERGPYVYINGSKKSELLTDDICRNHTINYTLDNNKLPNSIVMDFNLYCKESKLFFLGLMIYLGMLVGVCSSYLFADKIGRKKTLLIFIPFHIFFLCTFKILRSSFGESCIYIIYLNVFFLGICSHIIIITIIIYICEIIKQTDIPIFVILIITGSPLSSLLGTFLFNIKSLDWRDSLLVIAGINIIIYFYIFFQLVGSPIFSLNNELFERFILDLILLGKKNGIKLSLNDFEFLNPYMSEKSRKTVYRKFLEGINELNSNLINKSSNLRSESNSVIDNENAFISSNNNLEILSKNALKDEYLLSNESSQQTLKLFGKLKMKDYSPLDLIRFKKQIKNFLTLSFLWFATMLIKNGINLQSKYIQKMKEEIYWPIFNYLLEIIAYYIILFLLIKLKIAFHNLLMIIQIISFIIFMVILHTDLIQYDNYQIVLLLLGRLCWTCLFTLLSVISVLIYPIMIRTKGFGWNKSFGFLGAILSNILIEFSELKNSIYIFLIVDFFTMTLSYGLPYKIGTFILENPSHIPKDKDKKTDNENENNDIEINLFIKDDNDILKKNKTTIIG